MKSFLRFTAILLALVSTSINAQGIQEHEFGLLSGYHQMRSDYGERGDASTRNGNSGFTFGLSYYINKASSRRANYFEEHVKYRFDFLYLSSNLEHYGQYADDPRLEAMSGSFTSLGLSGGLEYYPLGIQEQGYNRSYTFISKLSPYGGIAVGLNLVTPEATSSLEGGLANPQNIFPSFISQDSDNGIVLDNRIVGSLNLRLGLRFNFNPRTGLFVESSWMLFGSDLVDGLSPVGPQNKYTDWTWGINLGFSTLIF